MGFLATDGRTWRRNSTTVPGGASTTVPGGASTTGLKFDLKNAMGLTLKSPVSSTSVRKQGTGSNLQTVDSAGNTTDAVTSGSASISRFLIAPNDKLYVVFSKSTSIGPGGADPCILAEVARDTGVPVCIESDVNFRFIAAGQSKNKFSSGVTGFRNLVNDFQFDSDGAIYYMGIPGTQAEFPRLSCCTSYEGEAASVVRRFKNGRLTDLGLARLEQGRTVEPGFTGDMSGQVMIRNPIYNFLVTGSGDVLVDQGLEHLPLVTTPPTYCQFARLDIWRPTGQRVSVGNLMSDMENTSESCRLAFAAGEHAGDGTVRASNALGFLRMFDGSTILAGTGHRIFRVNVDTVSATEIPYLTVPGTVEGAGRTSNVNSYCGVDVATHYDFRQWFCGGGTMWRSTWRTSSGHNFAVAGQDPGCSCLFGREEYERAGVRYGSGVLVRVWPTVAPTALGFDSPSAVLTRIETFLPIADSVVASGSTVDGDTKTVLFDTQRETSETLIPASSNLHPLKFSFNAGANKVLFATSGAVGVIDLATKKFVTVASSGVQDLQTFSS